MADTLEQLAARLEAYDPKSSPDNYGDELELHRDIVMETGIGGMNPAFEDTFARSLDAAMTLVPEGWYWRVGHSTLYAGWASTNRLHPDHCNPGDETFAKAATPALALCAAALRAIAKERG